jgi:plasmid stabilization system protein ParE
MMVEKILRAIELLKTFRHRTIVSGQHPRLKQPVRSLAVRPFIIFFRVIEANRVVRILHVRHGARRRPRRFE